MRMQKQRGMRSCVYLSRSQTAASESLTRCEVRLCTFDFLLQIYVLLGEDFGLCVAQDEIQEQMLCSSDNV